MINAQEIYKSDSGNLLICMVYQPRGSDIELPVFLQNLDVIEHNHRSAICSDFKSPNNHPLISYDLPDGFVCFGIDSFNPDGVQGEVHKVFVGNGEYRPTVFVFLAKPGSLTFNEIKDVFDYNIVVKIPINGDDKKEIKLSPLRNTLRIPSVLSIKEYPSKVAIEIDEWNVGRAIGEKGWRLKRFNSVCSKHIVFIPPARCKSCGRVHRDNYVCVCCGKELCEWCAISYHANLTGNEKFCSHRCEDFEINKRLSETQNG